MKYRYRVMWNWRNEACRNPSKTVDLHAEDAQDAIRAVRRQLVEQRFFEARDFMPLEVVCLDLTDGSRHDSLLPVALPPLSREEEVNT